MVAPIFKLLVPFRLLAVQRVAARVILMVGLLVRFMIGLGPYSGMNTPPRYGDFEAQRHWIELTTHIPIREWYWHDLEWWGLDYPPLTAYHSWIMGQAAKIFTRSADQWFALYTSRGMESIGLKAFMRATVVISDLLIYVPPLAAVVFYISKNQTTLTARDSTIGFAILLFQPALLLIDHGHFQYNSVMLGLSVLSIACLFNNRIYFASASFILSVCFKQMALYYAPAIFAYLIGICLPPDFSSFLVSAPYFTQPLTALQYLLGETRYLRLFVLALTVAITFAAVFAPLIIFNGVVAIPSPNEPFAKSLWRHLFFGYSPGFTQVHQCIVRVFPFSRGLWEGKVANFWCAANTFFKMREFFSNNQLKLMSLIFTLVSILPACLALMCFPQKRLIVWGFAASAWGFFLFSFQVHEKTVLVPLIPSTILATTYLEFSNILGQKPVPPLTINGAESPSKKRTIFEDGADHENIVPMILWINNIAVFSLWPLLHQDGLGFQTFVTWCLWAWLFNAVGILPNGFIKRSVVISSQLIAGIIIFMELILEAISPDDNKGLQYLLPRHPDIFVVANLTLSFACFAFFFLYIYYNIWGIVAKECQTLDNMDAEITSDDPIRQLIAETIRENMRDENELKKEK